MRNIFFKKSYTKCGAEASLRPSYKKSKLSISLIELSKMLQSEFLLYFKVKVYQNILKLRWSILKKQKEWTFKITHPGEISIWKNVYFFLSCIILIDSLSCIILIDSFNFSEFHIYKIDLTFVTKMCSYIHCHV